MSTTMDIDSVITEADRHFPALYQLFGGYFHQDWREDHDDPDAAVRAFTLDAPPDAVAAAADELDDLLGSGLDDSALNRILEQGFGCDYSPSADGITALQWLEGILHTLRAGSPY